jgi:hypothetical protein
MARSSFAKSFFRIFPPPAYINIPYAGIDISDSAIHCIEFKRSRHNRDELEIGAYDSVPLPQGVVEDGYVKNAAALTTALTDIAKKHGIVRARASLPEAKVYLFRTAIQSLDEKEIAQNIESKLEENVPLSAADAIFNFTVIPSGGNLTGNPINNSVDNAACSASVSVVPAKVVETYLEVFKSSGITISSFEVQSRALTRAIVPRDSHETIMLVYGMNNVAARQRAGIYIVYHGVLCFSVTVSIDSESVDSIGKGIKEVAEYWLDHGEPTFAPVGKRNVDRIIVCAPSPLATVVERIAMEMKIPVSTALVWVNAFSTEKYTPTITIDDSLGYAIAAGLALPYVRC